MNDINAAIIEGYLKQLRLPGIARHLPEVAREAEKYNGPTKLDTKSGSFKLHFGHEDDEETVFTEF